ncbi:RES family NAD+ phosphorylase [Chelativorans sp. YIM 93263]|uniref:RES family NAD+ phosphorylase n=1 Tax=Chelativorans sp. YIM 93263 TaxID=2906648 RepID=UPI002379924C|nr:RES family NAD+ phosphorylase [Chelativorans sp. YIM 93263]
MIDFPLVDFNEAHTHRLLSSAYVDEPAIAPLYDDDDEKEILDALEARTSSRLLGQAGKLDEVSPGELLTETFGYGWTYVNAAFVYTRVGGNRFNGEGRGAWYAALAVETCLAEVGFHLTRELKNTGETENTTQYVQLLAHIAGRMASLVGREGEPCLDPDTAVGYPAGQKLAEEMRGQGLGGIIYPAVRHAGGTCIATLRPDCIRQVTRGASYRLVWSGGKGPEVVFVK